MNHDKFRVSSESIRRTNRHLIDRGVNIQEVSYSGTITTRVMVDGQERIHSFSEAKIREAYSKSLEQYAEKL